VKLGLHVPNFASLGGPADLVDLAARAEASGWDGFFVWDHVARPEGTFPMAEPWIALTAIAMTTQRLRIGPLVAPLARRRPWNVARQVATLGQVTGGRVTLPVPVQPRLPIWGATERISGRPVRRAATLDGVFPVGLKPSDLPALLDNVARHRPGGLDGYDVVTVGTDNWQAWQDTGATWWLHELPWRRPLSESAAIIEAGPPAG
jgi:hypothetical protein